MGLDLIYKGDGREFITRFSMVDWDSFGQLERFLPGPVITVVGGTSSELGEELSIPVVALREAISQIDDFLRNRFHLLPFTYSFKAEYLYLNGHRFAIDHDFVTGMRSGLQLPGDEGHRYAIQAALDICYLIKTAIGPDGKGMEVERRDLRNEHSIQTLNCGLVQIQKQRSMAGLREELGKIDMFLTSLGGPDVTRVVC